MSARIILALNLFRDQLDRYGEVDTISQRWQKAICELSPQTVVVLNADDPTLSHLGQQLDQPVRYFGLAEPNLYLEAIPMPWIPSTVPAVAILWIIGVYLSHLGDFSCPSCGFSKSQPLFTVASGPNPHWRL